MLARFTSKLIRGSTQLRTDNLTRGVSIRMQSTDYSTCEGLEVEPKDQILWIKFNRPKKYNAYTRDMYIHMTEAFKTANDDKKIKAVVLTGTGDYYSSGNDLNNLTLALQDKDGPQAGFTKSTEILISYVDSLINLRKFLISAVNGPAVGIPVTTLPLCDYVICSDRATFQTPFTALGQCPEACSSYTIPTMMGRSRASELLLLNMTWDSKRAQTYGLVSEVVEHEQFHKHLDGLLKRISSSCYPESMVVSKTLMQSEDCKKRLMEVNRIESAALLQRWLSEECADALGKFLQRSKK